MNELDKLIEDYQKEIENLNKIKENYDPEAEGNQKFNEVFEKARTRSARRKLELESTLLDLEKTKLERKMAKKAQRSLKDDVEDEDKEGEKIDNEDTPTEPEEEKVKEDTPKPLFLSSLRDQEETTLTRGTMLESSFYKSGTKIRFKESEGYSPVTLTKPTMLEGIIAEQGDTVFVPED